MKYAAREVMWKMCLQVSIEIEITRNLRWHVEEGFVSCV